MKASRTALLARLERFLDGVRQRQQQALAETEAGIAALLATRPGDTRVLRNALAGVEHQMKSLWGVVDSTWEEQIEPLFLAEDEEQRDFYHAGRDMIDERSLDFSEAWQSFRAKAEADCLRAWWPEVSLAMQRRRACQGCGADVTMLRPHVPESVKCSYCSAVNQLLPQSEVQHYFADAPRVFAEEASLPIRYQIERFRKQAERNTRGSMARQETLSSLQSWRELEFRYWSRYAQVHAQVLGDAIDENLIQGRMRAMDEMLAYYPAWRNR